MIKRMIPVKAVLATLACTACVSLQAQEEFPKQEKMTPGMSEYWTPQPAVVTPGTTTPNAFLTAPSDAIVLLTAKTFLPGKAQEQADLLNGL